MMQTDAEIPIAKDKVMESDGERRKRKKEEINEGGVFIDEVRAGTWGTGQGVFLLEVNGYCVASALLSR